MDLRNQSSCRAESTICNLPPITGRRIYFGQCSEHEGFCVPLVEAMGFDIPILAYRSTAVPETLGDAALMFTDKGDLHAVAAIASLLLTDRTLRQPLINAQRRRRAQFLQSRFGLWCFICSGGYRRATLHNQISNADERANRGPESYCRSPTGRLGSARNGRPVVGDSLVAGKNRRGWKLDEFLKTGEDEVQHLMTTLVVNDIPFVSQAGLDFGCGVGVLAGL